MISDLESSNGVQALPAFGMSHDDKREIAETLPEAVQEELRVTLAYLKQIHFAANKAREIRCIAKLPHNKSRLGFSEGSLTRKYYKFIEAGGDWRVLVNRAKAPAEKSALPRAFILFFQKLCEDNQRCCAHGIRELLHIWRHHRSFDGKTEYREIPGYAEWPTADERTGVPQGWVDRNLYRYLPHEFHLTLARQGRAAASAHRLKVYRTRVGLRIGEFIQFDDHEYNVKVNFPGQWKAMRPRGFTAIDVLTSMPFAKSFKPTLWDDDNEKKITLNQRHDFKWFVIHALCDFGYRVDERGTVFVVEHGMAAVDDVLEKRIFDATDGKVRFERSGKFGTEGKGRLAVATQFNGAVKGNFRFKALIESFWNIIDNYLASIPGQVGKDRNHAPEQIHGADIYNNKLLKLEALLADSALHTPHSALIKPFYTWTEFLDAALRCYDAIERTHKHDCEGWEKCNFEIKEWRLAAEHPWLPYEKLLALEDEPRRMAENMVLANPLLRSSRRMSRAEAWHSLRHQLNPLPAWHWPTLMGIENAVRDGEAFAPIGPEFVIEIDKQEHRFLALDEYGARLRDKYVCFMNPCNANVLVACDAKLRVKALCKAITPSCYNDVEGINRQLGQQRSLEAREIAEFHVKHSDKIKEKTAMHEHNQRLIANAPAPHMPAPAVIEDCSEEYL